MIIKDSVAIVTGGGSGLGLGIASVLLEKQAKVVVLDIDKEKLAKLSEKFIKYQVDVTNYEAVQAAIDDVVSKYERIHILVNNAGAIYNEPLINVMNRENMKHSYENFKKFLDVNLNSVFIMSSIVAEKMVLKRTKGVIINISSISANGNAGLSVYAAAKAGVNALTKTWAKELGVLGIRTVAIAPGFINTESTNKALSKEVISHIKREVPLRNLGKVEDIAHSVLYAIENEYLNGAVIEVNGGLTI
ncbi:MAG: SDR family oxidoreductase [Deltaproteobacteria bacterium]|nr:SDR family oxidoreductase [Deltaproteobacteria bacterium]